MEFNKLRLLGFKSFVEPTEFVIERGLTGVVGPNGCGKSNLVEALRWVMGENSYKNMRASAHGRRDFLRHRQPPGPQHRPRSRSFSTTPTARRPAAFNDADELQVTRRIEREAGLGLPHQRQGRARHATCSCCSPTPSTGARSPSMVGQGQIGELISAKPQARRRCWRRPPASPACTPPPRGGTAPAGRRDQSRPPRRRASAQLDSQIDSLKRQARQANRYRESVRRDPQGRGARCCICAGSPADRSARPRPQSALPERDRRRSARRRSAQAEAAKARRSPPTSCPNCARRRPSAAAALQRLVDRAQRARRGGARAQAPARAELDRRLEQFGDDIAREEHAGRRQRARSCSRLDDEEQRTSRRRRDGADAETARARRRRGAARTR